jgi:hypothetical protein
MKDSELFFKVKVEWNHRRQRHSSSRTPPASPRTSRTLSRRSSQECVRAKLKQTKFSSGSRTRPYKLELPLGKPPSG